MRGPGPTGRRGAGTVGSTRTAQRPNLGIVTQQHRQRRVKPVRGRPSPISAGSEASSAISGWRRYQSRPAAAGRGGRRPGGASRVPRPLSRASSAGRHDLRALKVSAPKSWGRSPSALRPAGSATAPRADTGSFDHAMCEARNHSDPFGRKETVNGGAVAACGRPSVVVDRERREMGASFSRADGGDLRAARPGAEVGRAPVSLDNVGLALAVVLAVFVGAALLFPERF